MRTRRSLRYSSVLALWAAVSVSGCYKGGDFDPNAGDDPTAGDEEGDDVGDTPPTAFECDDSLVPESVPLRRLTKVQYRNSVRDLLRWALPGEGEAVADLVEPRIAAVPDDARQAPDGVHHGGFVQLDQSVHQEHIDATYEVGRAVGAALTQDPMRFAAVVGACATDGDTSNDQWLGSALQAMGMPRDSYESGEYGGYGEHFMGEGREAFYPSSVLDVQGQWLPWLES